MTTQSIASQDTSRAWIDIDLGALLRNAEALSRLARVPLLPMVKADSYGLGAVAVARALSKLDPYGFGVADVHEGQQLRAAGFWRPIIVFTPLVAADVAIARDIKLTPALDSPAGIKAWTESGGGPWHLAIDTGMGRTGVPWDAMGSVVELVRQRPPEGAFTHFHSAELDNDSMAEQDRRFRTAVAALPERPSLLHTQNSAAIVRQVPSPWSLVRPGVFLFGVGSGGPHAVTPEPVVHMRARIVSIRDMKPGDTVSYDATWTARRPTRAATIGVGYADGYRRALSNAGAVLIEGRKANVIGIVTMDMTMVDVTDIPCTVGDVVTMIGTSGDQTITVENVATASRLSPYEILTGLRQRLPRRYA